MRSKQSKHRKGLQGKQWWTPLIISIVVCSIAWPMYVLVQQASTTVHMVQGVLTGVQARSLVEAETITLRDEHGHTFVFQVDPEVMTNQESPQSASHLRQHMALAEPVLVRYRESPNGLVALRIIDLD
jgi:hypothetical protein